MRGNIGVVNEASGERENRVLKQARERVLCLPSSSLGPLFLRDSARRERVKRRKKNKRERVLYGNVTENSCFATQRGTCLLDSRERC